MKIQTTPNSLSLIGKPRDIVDHTSGLIKLYPDTTLAQYLMMYPNQNARTGLDALPSRDGKPIFSPN